jgi:hypothetical protein
MDQRKKELSVLSFDQVSETDRAQNEEPDRDGEADDDAHGPQM